MESLLSQLLRRHQNLIAVTILGLALWPGMLYQQVAAKSAATESGRIFIATDRATLKFLPDREVVEDKNAEKKVQIDLPTSSGRLRSSFFSDNGQDELTWLSSEDDRSFQRTDLDTFARESEGKKVVLFVHGCCVSFKEMEQQARDLERGLRDALGDRVILISYDWSTPALYYSGSLKNMDTTQVRFNKFLTELRGRIPAGRLSVVMHSLGGNLMVRYLTGPGSEFAPRDKNTPKLFHLLIFSRPDMSLDSFVTHAADVSLTADHNLILAAENDININLSGFIRSLRGYTFGSFRLGQMHNARELSPQLNVLDVGSLRLGHKIPYKLIGNLVNIM